MVVELHLHAHWPVGCYEMQLLWKDQSRLVGGQTPLFVRADDRIDDRALMNANDAPDASLGAVVLT